LVSRITKIKTIENMKTEQTQRNEPCTIPAEGDSVETVVSAPIIQAKHMVFVYSSIHVDGMGSEIMRDTPRTNTMITGNSSPDAEEYEELATFTRQLEREAKNLRCILDEIKKEIYGKDYENWEDSSVATTIGQF